MGSKADRRTFSSVLASLFSCFCSVDRSRTERRRSAASPTGPEADMVAAAKHFSSAHKVNLG